MIRRFRGREGGKGKGKGSGMGKRKERERVNSEKIIKTHAKHSKIKGKSIEPMQITGKCRGNP